MDHVQHLVVMVSSLRPGTATNMEMKRAVKENQFKPSVATCRIVLKVSLNIN